MTNIWNWIVSHWGSGLFGFIGGLLGGTFKWFAPSSLKEWKEGSTAKREAKADAKVLTILRALCVNNSLIYDTESIAEKAGMDLDETADSLERLKWAGRVRVYEDAGPGWRSKER